MKTASGYYAVAFFIVRLAGVLMTAIGLMVWAFCVLCRPLVRSCDPTRRSRRPEGGADWPG